MILVCGHCKEDPKLSVPGGLTKEDEHVHTNTLCWKIKIMLKHQIVECSDKLSEKAVKGEMDWTSTSLTLGPRGDSGDGTAWMSLWPAIYIHKKMLNHKVNIGHVRLNLSLTSFNSMRSCCAFWANNHNGILFQWKIEPLCNTIDK